MSWTYAFDPLVLPQLHEAIVYYLASRPAETPESFITLADEAFERPLHFPEATPPAGRDSRGGVMRRVNVWRFAFLYRVDAAREQLVVERIFHERSAEL